MNKAIVLVMVMLLLISVDIVFANPLPAIKATEKLMFKKLVQDYLSSSINGWGIGLNVASDSYLVAKFNAVTVKTLSRDQVTLVLKNAKERNVTKWSEVKDMVKVAIDSNGTTFVKGRIKINKEIYVLTGITRTDTEFKGDIRATPEYSACAQANTSAEDCELQSTKVGDLSLTRKNAEFETGKDMVWAGTMNFNNTQYTFVAIVNPRVS